jgi:FkbH-like protein
MKKIKALVFRNITVEPIFQSLSEIFKKNNIIFDYLISNYDDYRSFLSKNKLYNVEFNLFFFSTDGYFKSHNSSKINLKLIKKKIDDDFDITKNINNKGRILFINITNTKFVSHKNFVFIERYIAEKIKKFEKIEINKAHLYSKKFWNKFLYPFNSQGTEFLSIHLRNKIMNFFGKSFKMIIVDADNTLWNGVIGEDGFGKINFKKNNFNFYEFQKKIMYYKSKGVLLALCTKNNLQDIKNFFKYKKNKMHIKLSDFVEISSNWERKSDNILKIIKTINILPEHVFFIDDNIREIKEVSQKIRKLNCFQLEHNEETISELDRTFIINEFSNTKEDKKKTELYKKEFKREKIKNNNKSFDDYLKKLKISLNIKIDSKKNIPRLSQLTQKVNQFNSTTIRMSEQDVKTYIDSKNKLVFQAEAKDIYGDYGIIGLAFVKIINSNSSIISNFLFSCRAIGREIEDYFLYNILKYLEGIKIKKTFLLFHYNKKNDVAKGFFSKILNKKINNNLQKFVIKANNINNTKKKLIKCLLTKN